MENLREKIFELCYANLKELHHKTVKPKNKKFKLRINKFNDENNVEVVFK